jgi:hypothetical protein
MLEFVELIFTTEILGTCKLDAEIVFAFNVFITFILEVVTFVNTLLTIVLVFPEILAELTFVKTLFIIVLEFPEILAELKFVKTLFAIVLEFPDILPKLKFVNTLFGIVLAIPIIFVIRAVPDTSNKYVGLVFAIPIFPPVVNILPIVFEFPFAFKTATTILFRVLFVEIKLVIVLVVAKIFVELKFVATAFGIVVEVAEIVPELIFVKILLGIELVLAKRFVILEFVLFKFIFVIFVNTLFAIVLVTP